MKCKGQRKPHKGLGDTIAAITAATGIEKTVQAVSKATGHSCRCKQRQQALNRMFPYRRRK